MNRRILLVPLIMIISSSTGIPAYAEVLSLQTSQPLYTTGNKIHFTGTVGIGDYQKLVNLIIDDPTGKFVLISGNYSDSAYTFEIVVDTNNTDQFYKKGTYQAIAFVGKESDGKTLSFDFSPDGSPVIHQVPPSNNTHGTTPSGQVTSQHYKSQLNENVGLADTAGDLAKLVPTSVSTEKSSVQFDYKNLLYPIISLCGIGIVIAVLYGRKRTAKTETQRHQETPPSATTADRLEDDYALMILKNRLAKGEISIEDFKAIRDALSEP